MAEIAEVTGADLTQLADAIGHEARIGRRFLGAGIGFGGGCLPKDIRAFAARAEELGRGQSVACLHEVDAINLRRRDRAKELVIDALGGSVVGKRLLFSERPSNLIRMTSETLQLLMWRLNCEDSELTLSSQTRKHSTMPAGPTLNFSMITSLDKTLLNTDVVLVVTEWDEYRREFSPTHAASLALIQGH